jgi:hypothetical protein
MSQLVNADPVDYFAGRDVSSRSCEACGSRSLTSGRLDTGGSRHGRLDRVVMFACDACGDFWFERDGELLNAASMRQLGLLSR